MLRTCLIFCGLVLSGSAFADDGTPAYCADQWGTNFVMRENCQTEQAIAQYTMDIMFENFSSEPGVKESMRECVNRWREKEFDTFNWVMVKSCFDDQTAAYKRLNNIR